jgi:branched-chain amino acid transport system substrate-binding protein
MGKRMLTGKGFDIAILAVALAALLLITACAPAPLDEGKQVVGIGFIMGLTGAAAAPEQAAFRVALNYFRYFDEEIGIPGVTIEPVWADTGLDVPRAISAYQRFVDAGVVLLWTVNTNESEAIKARCEKDEVPVITMAVTEALIYPPGWIYAIHPTESERFAIVCDWIMENWREERPPRLAFMGLDAPYGRACEVTGAKYAESIGIEMAPMEIVPYMPLDTSPQLLRLHERGVDYVYITAIWSTVMPIMKDAERLGLIGKIRFGGYENTQTEALLRSLGPSVEGHFAPRGAPWYKGVPLLIDMQMRYRGTVDLQGDEAGTLVFGAVTVEAIKRAIEEVGYENLDGRAIKEALDSIKDFDAHGIRKITYTPEDHRGSAAIRMYQVQGGEVVPVTDWREAPMLMQEGLARES